MSATSTRRPKWYHHPPPPPTPKILHFPRRRSSSSAFKVPASRPHTSSDSNALKLPTLKTLFNREEHACAHPHSQGVPIVVFGRDKSRRRTERVGIKNQSSNVVMGEEEKWKFQADMLRAECNILRMEKEIALKKLERTRSKMETTLRSALHTLLSGRIKVCEGMNIEMVLDQGIHELTQKLQKLHKRSGRIQDSQVSSKSNKNFDKQVSVLQRRLEKIGGSSDEIYLREFQEMEKVSLSIKTSGRIDDDTVVARGKLNVEILRRKMEGLSKGKLLQRMEEEYNSMLSTATNSLASSASTSRRIEFQDSSSSTRVLSHQDSTSKMYGEGKLCSGHCKTIVRRIMEQVRAETEQWSQMQEMLGQVREEMEELQASRDFWEDCAHNSDFQIQSLHNSVQEWRDRALSSEIKTNELEEKITELSSDLERMRNEKHEKNDCVHAAVTECSSSQVPLLETQKELEKRVVVCSSKENTHIIENRKHDKEIVAGNRERRGTQDTIGGVLATKRSPFRDIGNLKIRQDGKTVSPFHSHLSSKNADKIYYSSGSDQTHKHRST